jgi:prepilin-type N-terminal cleavage/methylation domain-containing protein
MINLCILGHYRKFTVFSAILLNLRKKILSERLRIKDGFTLIEVALVIFITVILMSISLRFTVFTGDTLYLKNFVYKLGSNMNLLKDFSLSRKSIINNLSETTCGNGILFSNSGYYSYAFVTSSSKQCDVIASTTPEAFVPFSPVYYLHTNGDILQSPIEQLQIKDDFKPGLKLKISTSSSNCSDNLFPEDSISEIALVYYNPYGELLLLGNSGGSWTNLLSPDWRNIYFCLSYKNEERYLIINRAGQLLISR